MKNKHLNILFMLFMAIIVVFNTPLSLRAQSGSYLDTIYQAVDGNSDASYSGTADAPVASEGEEVNRDGSDTIVIDTDDPNATVTVSSNAPESGSSGEGDSVASNSAQLVSVNINNVLTNMTRILVSMNMGININTSSFTVIDIMNIDPPSDNPGDNPDNPDNPGDNPDNPDNPGDNPDNPDNPGDNPDNPDNPGDNPDNPDNPGDNPDNPDNPGDNPDNPDNPGDNPDNPDNPGDNPDNPDNPGDNPDNPDNPGDNPDNPDNPGDNPDNPDNPGDNPDNPDNPGDNPDNPDNPGDNPDNPDNPGDNPDNPDNPGDNPDNPDNPGDNPDNPDNPGNSQSEEEKKEELVSKIKSKYNIDCKEGTSTFTSHQLELIDQVLSKMPAEFRKYTTEFIRDTVDPTEEDPSETLAYVITPQTKVHLLDLAIHFTEEQIQEINEVNNRELTETDLIKMLEFQFMSTVAHEMTHCFQNREKGGVTNSWADTFWPDGKIREDSPSPSEYGNSSYKEDMAESVGYYMMGGKIVQDENGKEVFKVSGYTTTIDMERYNFIKENIMGGVEFLEEDEEPYTGGEISL